MNNKIKELVNAINNWDRKDLNELASLLKLADKACSKCKLDIFDLIDYKKVITTRDRNGKRFMDL